MNEHEYRESDYCTVCNRRLKAEGSGVCRSCDALLSDLHHYKRKAIDGLLINHGVGTTHLVAVSVEEPDYVIGEALRALLADGKVVRGEKPFTYQLVFTDPIGRVMGRSS